MLSKCRVLVTLVVVGVAMAGSGLLVAVTAPSSTPHRGAAPAARSATLVASYGCAYVNGQQPPSQTEIDHAVTTRSPLRGCVYRDNAHDGPYRLIADSWPNSAGYLSPDGGWHVFSGPINCWALPCYAGWSNVLFRSIPIEGIGCVYNGSCIYENYFIHDDSCSGAGAYLFMACPFSRGYGPYGLGLGESISQVAAVDSATYVGQPTCDSDHPACEMNSFGHTAVTIGGCPVCQTYWILSNHIIQSYGQFTGNTYIAG